MGIAIELSFITIEKGYFRQISDFGLRKCKGWRVTNTRRHGIVPAAVLLVRGPITIAPNVISTGGHVTLSQNAIKKIHLQPSSTPKCVLTPTPYTRPSPCPPIPVALFYILFSASPAAFHTCSKSLHFPFVCPSSILSSTSSFILIRVRPSRRHEAHLESAVAQGVHVCVWTKTRP
jgi:hypothetical protein